MKGISPVALSCNGTQEALVLHRHYTFYIWKNFFGVHPAAKFTLIPAYLYSAWSVWQSLMQGRQPTLLILGLVAASALTLVPAWLVDFRCGTLPSLCEGSWILS